MVWNLRHAEPCVDDLDLCCTLLQYTMNTKTLFLFSSSLQSAVLSKKISLQKYIDSLDDAAFAALKEKGLMLDGRVPKAMAAKTMEPEYIALGSGKAFVALQVSSALHFLFACDLLAPLCVLLTW